jgi:hypothetical protein
LGCIDFINTLVIVGVIVVSTGFDINSKLACLVI